MAACLLTEIMNCFLIVIYHMDVWKCIMYCMCLSLHMFIFNRLCFFFQGMQSWNEMDWWLCTGKTYETALNIFHHHRGNKWREILSASVSISLTLLYPLRNEYCFCDKYCHLFHQASENHVIVENYFKTEQCINALCFTLVKQTQSNAVTC